MDPDAIRQICRSARMFVGVLGGECSGRNPTGFSLPRDQEFSWDEVAFRITLAWVSAPVASTAASSSGEAAASTAAGSSVSSGHGSFSLAVERVELTGPYSTIPRLTKFDCKVAYAVTLYCDEFAPDGRCLSTSVLRVLT